MDVQFGALDRDDVSPASVMFCEVFSSFGNKLLEFLNKQRNNHALCDCVLVVENIEFPAHLCVVGASSDLLLQELMRVRKNNFSKISLTNETYAGFCPLFEYMYSGVLKFELCQVNIVQQCAMSLGLRDLDNSFDQYIKSTNLETESGSVLSVHGNIDTSSNSNLRVDCGVEKNVTTQETQYVIDKASLQDSLVQSENKVLAEISETEEQVRCPTIKDVVEPDTSVIGESPHILNDYLNFFATLSASATPIPSTDEAKSSQKVTSGGQKLQSQPFEPQVEDTTSVVKKQLPFCYGDDVYSDALSGSNPTPLDIFQNASSGNLSQQTTFPTSSQFIPEPSVNFQVPPSELSVPAISRDKSTPQKSNLGNMQLRKHRKLKVVEVNTYDDKRDPTSAASGRTVYIRKQAPFCIGPSQNAVQIGKHLNELLRRHGVTPSETAVTMMRRHGVTPSETAVTMIPKDKLTTKRKRRKPLKLQQVETSTDKHDSTSTKPTQKSKSKRKKSNIDEDSDDDETGQKAYNCSLCPRGFFRESSLKKHNDGHMFGGIHKCQVCSRSYVRLCDFTRHVRSHGTLRCEYCEFSTKSQKQFVDHNQKMHSTPKPFRCHNPNCSFSSGKLHDLDEHRLIHSEVKCFTCNFCGKTFSQKGGLYSHKKSCVQKRDFLCDVCGRAFNHLGSMKSHRRIHIGEKPFQCGECCATFSDHRNLKRHKLIHGNSFPYTCEYCDKPFRHSNSLKSHIKKQHFPNGSPESTDERLMYLTPPANPYMVPLETLPGDSLLHADRAAFDNQNMVQASQMFPVSSEGAYINQLLLQPQ